MAVAIAAFVVAIVLLACDATGSPPDAAVCGHEGEQCCVTGAAPPMCLDDLVCGLPVANVCR